MAILRQFVNENSTEENRAQLQDAVFSAYNSGLQGYKFVEGHLTSDILRNELQRRMATVEATADTVATADANHGPEARLARISQDQAATEAGRSPQYSAFEAERAQKFGDRTQAFMGSTPAGRGPGPDILIGDIARSHRPGSSDGILESITDASAAFAWHFVDSALLGLPRLAGWALKAAGVTDENEWTEGAMSSWKNTHTAAGRAASMAGEVAGFLAPTGPAKVVGLAGKGMMKGAQVGVNGAQAAKAAKLTRGAAKLKRLSETAGTVEKGSRLLNTSKKIELMAGKAAVEGNTWRKSLFMAGRGVEKAAQSGQVLKGSQFGGKLFQAPQLGVEKVLGKFAASKIGKEVAESSAKLAADMAKKYGSKNAVFIEEVLKKTAAEGAEGAVKGVKRLSPWNLAEGGLAEMAKSSGQIYMAKVQKKLIAGGLSREAAREIAEKAGGEFMEAMLKNGPKSLSLRWYEAAGSTSRWRHVGGVAGGLVEHGVDGAINMAGYGFMRRFNEHMGSAGVDGDELMTALKHGGQWGGESGIKHDLWIGGLFHTGVGLKVLPWTGKRYDGVRSGLKRWLRGTDGKFNGTAAAEQVNGVFRNVVKSLGVDPKKYRTYGGWINAMNKQRNGAGVFKRMIPDVEKMSNDDLRILAKMRLLDGVKRGSALEESLWRKFGHSINKGDASFENNASALRGALKSILNDDIAMAAKRAKGEFFADFVRTTAQFGATFAFAGGQPYLDQLKETGRVDLAGLTSHGIFALMSARHGVWQGSMGVGKGSYAAEREAVLGAGTDHLMPGHSAQSIERHQARETLAMAGVPHAHFYFADPALTHATIISPELTRGIKKDRQKQSEGNDVRNFLSAISRDVEAFEMPESIKIVESMDQLPAEPKEGVNYVTRDEINKMMSTIIHLKANGYAVPEVFDLTDLGARTIKDLVEGWDPSKADSMTEIVGRNAATQVMMAQAVVNARNFIRGLDAENGVERAAGGYDSFDMPSLSKALAPSTRRAVSKARKAAYEAATEIASILDLPVPNTGENGDIFMESLMEIVAKGETSPEILQLQKDVQSVQQMFKSLYAKNGIYFKETPARVSLTDPEMAHKLSTAVETLRTKLNDAGIHGADLDITSRVLAEHLMYLQRADRAEAVIDGGVIANGEGGVMDIETLARALSSESNPYVFKGEGDLPSGTRYLSYVDGKALREAGVDPNTVTQIEALMRAMAQVNGSSQLTEYQAKDLVEAGKLNAILDSKEKVAALFRPNSKLEGLKGIEFDAPRGLLGFLRDSNFLSESDTLNRMAEDHVDQMRMGGLSRNAKAVHELLDMVGAFVNRGDGKRVRILKKLVESKEGPDMVESHLNPSEANLSEVLSAVRKAGGYSADQNLFKVVEALAPDLDRILANGIAELVDGGFVRGYDTETAARNSDPESYYIFDGTPAGQARFKDFVDGVVSLHEAYRGEFNSLADQAASELITMSKKEGKLRVRQAYLDSVVGMIRRAMESKSPADYRRILTFLQDSDMLIINQKKGTKERPFTVKYALNTKIDPGKLSSAIRRMALLNQSYGAMSRNIDLNRIERIADEWANNFEQWKTEYGHGSVTLTKLEGELGLNSEHKAELRRQIMEIGQEGKGVEESVKSLRKAIDGLTRRAPISNRDAALKTVEGLKDHEVVGLLHMARAARLQEHHYLQLEHTLADVFDPSVDGAKHARQEGYTEMDLQTGEAGKENVDVEVRPGYSGRQNSLGSAVSTNIELAQEWNPASFRDLIMDRTGHDIAILHLIDKRGLIRDLRTNEDALLDLENQYFLGESGNLIPRRKDADGKEIPDGGGMRRGVFTVLGNLPKLHVNYLPGKQNAAQFSKYLRELVDVTEAHVVRDEQIRGVHNFAKELADRLERLDSGKMTEDAYWSWVDSIQGGRAEWRRLFKTINLYEVVGPKGIQEIRTGDASSLGFNALVRHQQAFGSSGSRINNELGRWAAREAVSNNRFGRKYHETERQGVYEENGELVIEVLNTSDAGEPETGGPSKMGGDFGLTPFLGDVLALSTGHNPADSYGSIKALTMGWHNGGGHLSKPNMTVRPEFQSISNAARVAGFVVDSSQKVDATGTEKAEFRLSTGETTLDVAAAMRDAAKTGQPPEIINRDKAVIKMKVSDFNFQTMSYPEVQGATKSHQPTTFWRQEAINAFSQQVFKAEQYVHAFQQLAGSLDPEMAAAGRNIVLKMANMEGAKPLDMSDMDGVVKYLMGSELASPRDLGMNKKLLSILTNQILTNHGFKGHTEAGARAAVAPDVRNAMDTGEMVTSHMDREIEMPLEHLHLGVKHVNVGFGEIHSGNRERLGIEAYASGGDFQEATMSAKDTGRHGWNWGVYSATGRGESGWLYNLIREASGSGSAQGEFNPLMRWVQSKHFGENELKMYGETLNDIFVDYLVGDPNSAVGKLNQLARDVTSIKGLEHQKMAVAAVTDLLRTMPNLGVARRDAASIKAGALMDLMNVFAGNRRTIDGREHVVGYEPSRRWRDGEGVEDSRLGRTLATYGITGVASRSPSNQPNDAMIQHMIGFWERQYGRQLTMNHLDVRLGEGDYDKDAFNYYFDTNRTSLGEIIALRNVSGGTALLDKAQMIPKQEITGYHPLKSGTDIREDADYIYAQGQAKGDKIRGVVINGRNVALKFLRDGTTLKWKQGGMQYRIRPRFEFDMSNKEMITALDEIGGLIQSSLDIKKGLPSEELLKTDALMYAFDRLFVMEERDGGSTDPNAWGAKDTGSIGSNDFSKRLVHGMAIPFRLALGLSGSIHEGDSSRSKPLDVMVNEASEYVRIIDSEKKNEVYRELMGDYILTGERSSSKEWRDVVNSVQVETSGSSEVMPDRVARMVNGIGQKMAGAGVFGRPDAVRGATTGVTVDALHPDASVERFLSNFTGGRGDLQRAIVGQLNRGFGNDAGMQMVVDRRTGALRAMNERKGKLKGLDILNNPKTSMEKYQASENVVSALAIEAALRMTPDLRNDKRELTIRMRLYDDLRRIRDGGFRQMGLAKRGKAIQIDKVMTPDLQYQMVKLRIAEMFKTFGAGNEKRMALELLMPEYDGHMVDQSGNKIPRFRAVKQDYIRAIQELAPEVWAEISPLLSQTHFTVRGGMSGNTALLAMSSRNMAYEGARIRGAAMLGRRGNVEQLLGDEYLRNVSGYREGTRTSLAQHLKPEYGALNSLFSGAHTLENQKLFEMSNPEVGVLIRMGMPMPGSANPLVNQAIPLRDRQEGGFIEAIIKEDLKGMSGIFDPHLKRTFMAEEKIRQQKKFERNEAKKDHPRKWNEERDFNEAEASGEITHRINRIMSNMFNYYDGMVTTGNVQRKNSLSSGDAKRGSDLYWETIMRDAQERAAEKAQETSMKENTKKDEVC